MAPSINGSPVDHNHQGVGPGNSGVVRERVDSRPHVGDIDGYLRREAGGYDPGMVWDIGDLVAIHITELDLDLVDGPCCHFLSDVSGDGLQRIDGCRNQSYVLRSVEDGNIVNGNDDRVVRSKDYVVRHFVESVIEFSGSISATSQRKRV